MKENAIHNVWSHWLRPCKYTGTTGQGLGGVQATRFFVLLLYQHNIKYQGMTASKTICMCTQPYRPVAQIPQCTSPISNNAPVPYPTKHHFVTEMSTCVHISITKWYIVRYLFNALWFVSWYEASISFWFSISVWYWNKYLTRCCEIALTCSVHII